MHLLSMNLSNSFLKMLKLSASITHLKGNSHYSLCKKGLSFTCFNLLANQFQCSLSLILLDWVNASSVLT